MHVWNALPFAPMAKGSRDQGMILRRDFVDHIKSLRDHHHRQSTLCGKGINKSRCVFTIPHPNTLSEDTQLGD